MAQAMVRDALNAFINGDAELARDVCERDDEVDQLNNQIFRELLTYMMEDPETITRAVDLILVGRHLERIADHATNIGEDVIYMVKGKTIKHHIEEGRAPGLRVAREGIAARSSCSYCRIRTSMPFSPCEELDQLGRVRIPVMVGVEDLRPEGPGRVGDLSGVMV